MLSMAPEDIAAWRVPVATPAFGAPDPDVDVLVPEPPLPPEPQAEISSGTAAASATPPLIQ
jgi:hypothetical protein